MYISSRMILIALPDIDFDLSEASITWKILSDAGFSISFATPAGKPAQADHIMLNGQGLGMFKSLLMARKDAIAAHQEMKIARAFLNPLSYDQVRAEKYECLILPGGHAPGMKTYLESLVLQKAVADFFSQEKIVGAICHGVVLAARSIDPQTGRSVLFNKKTTALLKSQEMLAYNLTKGKLGNYYRTYPTTVEDEIKSYLANTSQFIKGPAPVLRDTPKKLGRGFVLTDGKYISARWPGDVYNFAACLKQELSIIERFQR